MKQVVLEVIEWAHAQEVPELPADQVPGASPSERRALAALGGLAAALVKRPRREWPPQLHGWMDAGPKPPSALADQIRSLLAGDVDILAAVYEGIVSGANRRRLGTFFTPPLVVDFMLDEADAVVGVPTEVIDPGAGVGAFTMAALRRWPKARVKAVDVNVVTLGLLGVRTSLSRFTRAELVLADFLQWLPATQPSKRRLLLGNPPYTRHHELTRKEKLRAKELCHDLVKSSLAGLSAYFLASCIGSLEGDDGLVLLLPASWLESRYGAPLRSAVWRLSQRHVRLCAFPEAVELFPGTRVAAVILTVGPVTGLDQPLTVTHLSAGVESIGTLTNRLHSRDQIALPTEPSSLGVRLSAEVSGPEAGRPLSEIARVRRGVATGANAFFFLTDAQRKGLPRKATRRALCRIRHVTGVSLDQAAHDKIGDQGWKRWLLMVDAELAEDECVAALVHEGLRQGLNLRYLTSVRDPWYQVEEVAPPDIIVGAMSKNHLRAVVNSVKAIPANSMYGIYLADRTLRDPLVAWLNTSEGQGALTHRARHYGGGLTKIEPGDLLTIQIPLDHALRSYRLEQPDPATGTDEGLGLR